MSAPGFVAPKFTVGQVVFHPSYSTETRAKPCPDCLGAGEWDARTPAGEEFKIPCATCHPFLDGSQLEYMVYLPRVRTLTLGSIRWEEWPGQKGYQYMARETGVGTGTVYREDSLHLSHELAMEVAVRLAANAQREHDARVEANRAEQKRKARRRSTTVRS